MTHPAPLPNGLPNIWIRRAQRLLVALLAAMFLWLSIINRQDPMLVRVVDNVPIPCPDLQDSDLICDPIEENLQVELRAPQSVWDDLTPPFHQYLTVSLSPLGEGRPLEAGAPLFNCHVETAPESIEILTYRTKSSLLESPCRLHVNLQAPIVEESGDGNGSLTGNVLLPVTLERVGEIPDGFVLESLILDKRYVEIEGPLEQLERISKAQVFFPFYSYIFGAQEGEFAMPLSIRVLDREGNTLTGLELIPAAVTVSLQYSALPNTRRVSVVPAPAITIPSGYVLKAIQSEPEYVTLQGPTDLLDTVVDPMPVQSENPIDPPTRTFAFVAPLALPDGITANVEEVTFTLEVTHVILDNTQRAVAYCEEENPDLAYDFAPIFLHLRGPYEAFNLLYEMAADGEFDWAVLYDCPEEEGTFELTPTRFVFRHEEVEASNQITKISHDPPLMQLTVKRKSSPEP